MNWTDDVQSLLARSLSHLDDAVDLVWERVAERLGWYDPQTILSYRGFADENEVRVSGRVLANDAGGGPREDDAWWENLAATYQRFASRDVSSVPVELSYEGEKQVVETNEEGFYTATFPRTHRPTTRNRWRTVRAQVTTEDGDEIEALHDVIFPGTSGDLLVISDLDDTVIETGVTSMLLMARLTFLSNARTRTPLPGVSELYRALRDGTTAPPRSQGSDAADRPKSVPSRGQLAQGVCPIFYLSNSPWNLYDLLTDFLELNRIPKGPVFLQDFGLDSDKLIKPLESHKKDRIAQILGAYPNHRAILIGDSGEADPKTYLEAARSHPERVAAIYIRDVDPGTSSERDAHVATIAEEAGALEIPFVAGQGSIDFAEHAESAGWIPSESVEKVRAAVRADLDRPSLTEETNPGPT